VSRVLTLVTSEAASYFVDFAEASFALAATQEGSSADAFGRTNPITYDCEHFSGATASTF
jgi:hypothetical protein